MANVDKDWWKDATDEVEIETKTQLAIERNLLQRREDALKKMALEKKRQKEAREKLSRIEKMYALSHWAEQLGFSERTLRDWVKEGILEAQYIRGTYRVSERAVLEFVKREDQKRVG